RLERDRSRAHPGRRNARRAAEGRARSTHGLRRGAEAARRVHRGSRPSRVERRRDPARAPTHRPRNVDRGREGARGSGKRAGAAPTVLSTEMIEELAQLSADPSKGTPEDRLVRALLRARDGDGDPIGAQAALNAGPLPPGEPLVADLMLRVHGNLEQMKEAEG